MVILRKAKENDIADIYKYLHRDFIKKYSSNSEKDEWIQHKRWYKFLINSETYLLYIVEDENGSFLGQVKFEIDEEIAVVSLYLIEDIRGRGIGKGVLEISLEELTFESNDVKDILAYILDENERSIRLFKSCGFDFIGQEEHQGLDHLVYRKSLKVENL